MSKIYEALLRAELERTASDGNGDASAGVAIEEPFLFAPEVEKTRVDHLPQDVVAVHSATEPTRSNLDLQAVSRRKWSPRPGSVPALGERGPEVEQFRSLRSHVAEFRDQGPLRTILVSSGLPGEGKSFVALNLALAFSRHKGNRVLLIDGDMRRSSLHKALGAPREPGLTEYLSGEAAMIEVMQQADALPGTSLPPGLGSLVFIGGGRDADKAGDLAANARFGELLETAGTCFDWIIVDSSPVNLVSDAVSLAHACDGVLLVCREGVTRYRTAQQAQTQFKNAKVLGFALNAVRSQPKGDYYSSYDAYRQEA